MKRYCLALDLKDDPALIAEYKRYHEAGWPDEAEPFEVRQNFRVEFGHGAQFVSGQR